MRFAFRALAEPGAAASRPRPALDLVVEGLDALPQACLLDTGASAIRLGAHVADLCGVDLADAPATRLAVGGMLATARMAEVALRVADGRDSHEWTAPVWFCDPWRPAFGLLGLTGFFDRFEVTIAAYEERIELVPVGA